MNSNQYSSLPHTQNGGGVGQQRYGTNQQQNGDHNSRNYKKKHYNNKRNYNTNCNNPNQNSPQFNNSYGYNNHTGWQLSQQKKNHKNIIHSFKINLNFFLFVCCCYFGCLKILDCPHCHIQTAITITITIDITISLTNSTIMLLIWIALVIMFQCLS